MAVCHPCQEFIADDAADLSVLKAYLTGLGYTVGVSIHGTRTDDDANLTVKIDYPEWTLEV